MPNCGLFCPGRSQSKFFKNSEKKVKFQDFARELKKLWNMKVTMIPVVTGALGTITKGLIQGLEDPEIRG